MSLRQLLARKRMVILGLNSGTSADGLDLAVLEISPSHVTPAKYLAGKCVAYPPHLRDAVLTLSDAHITDLNHLVYLDHALGEFYGTAAARFLTSLSHRGITIDAIGSHGQTVRHLPAPTTFLGRKVHGTLQIGSLEMIATLTGKPVIGDFRQADVALGHEGAPITVAAMARLFGHLSQSRLIVNIGGMANYFYFPAGPGVSGIRAADTGPGNVLSDLLCRTLHGKQFDRGGRFAARGMVSRQLLEYALNRGQAGHRTTSTGREVFGAAMADDLMVRARPLKLAKDDIIATGLEVTVERLRRHLMPLIRKDSSIDKLYLTGGGVHNSFLVERLKQVLSPCEVGSVADLGFNPDLVEASAYAVMGYACLRSESLPTRFGRRHRDDFEPICGRVVQPPIRTRRT